MSKVRVKLNVCRLCSAYECGSECCSTFIRISTTSDVSRSLDIPDYIISRRICGARHSTTIKAGERERAQNKKHESTPRCLQLLKHTRSICIDASHSPLFVVPHKAPMWVFRLSAVTTFATPNHIIYNKNTVIIMTTRVCIVCCGTN